MRTELLKGLGNYLHVPGFETNVFDKEKARAVRRSFVTAGTRVTIIVSVADQRDHLHYT